MGFAAPVVDAVSDAVQNVVAEVPIVGQPAAELIQEVTKPHVEILEEIDKPHQEVLQEFGIIPEPIDPLPPVETPQFAGPEQQSTQSSSSRQFSDTTTQGQRSRRRRSQQEGTPLGSILLSPSVLGTSRSLLGETKGSLG